MHTTTNKGGRRVKKIYLAIICLAAAAGLLFWSLGVASDFFRSKAFSSFWWLSYEQAHMAEFLALTIGGAALMVGINFWVFREEKKPKLPKND